MSVQNKNDEVYYLEFYNKLNLEYSEKIGKIFIDKLE